MSPSAFLVHHRTAFRRALLAWYDDRKRDLPWRLRPTVYKTVVSEFMLQQTQVKTALPYFDRWIHELPDFAALAKASEERVLKLWEGLGYYSRARNLHRLARTIVTMDQLPSSPEAWRELPGVGPYTAAAITSIAFGTPAACVDGNVVRILARLTADAEPRRDSASAARVLAPLAAELLEPSRPGDHNQAMMELGATLCLRHNPQCLLCPVASWCGARESGDPGQFPHLAAKSIERREQLRVWCLRDGSLLLHRAASDALRLKGIHELPTPAQAGLDPGDVGKGPLLARHTRGITRFQITEFIHEVPFPARTLPPGATWVPLEAIDALILSGPHRRWISALLADRRPQHDLRLIKP